MLALLSRSKTTLKGVNVRMRNCYLLVLAALCLFVFAGQALAHGAFRGEWWIAANWTVAVIGPGYGFAGPGVGNITHYNVDTYWHRYAWVSRPKNTHANIHISFPRRGTRKCLHMWNSRNNWEWEYCIDTSTPARAAEAIAGGVRNFMWVSLGIAIPVWLAYVIAGMLTTLALA